MHGLRKLYKLLISRHHRILANDSPGADANSVCAIQISSCFSRCLRVPIAMRRFYKPSLWIPQHSLLTNPNLHHGLLTFDVKTEHHLPRETLSGRLALRSVDCR